MKLKITTNRGLSILEGALVMAILTPLLYGAWYLCAYAQMVRSVDDLLEEAIFDSAARVLSYDFDSGELAVNQGALSSYLDKAQKKIESALILEMGEISPSSYRIDSAALILSYDELNGDFVSSVQTDIAGRGGLGTGGVPLREAIDEWIEHERSARPIAHYALPSGPTQAMPRYQSRNVVCVFALSVSAERALNQALRPASKMHEEIVRTRAVTLRGEFA